MKRAKTILLWGLLVVCLPEWAHGQFKSLMRTADKEYELHAFEKAAANYEQALERRSEDADALTGLANAYRHLNRMTEAAQAFEKASQQKDFNLVNYFYYGHVLKALGRYEEAKRAYLRYADIDPNVGRHFAGTCDFAQYNISRLSNYQVAPVGANSSQSDFGPAFFLDRVAFSSARPSLQPSGQDFSGQPFNNLMQAQPDPQGSLAVPVPLFPDLRRGVNLGPITVAPNGKLVAYTKNNFTSGVRHISSSGMRLDLFFAQLDPNGNWGGEIPFTYNSEEHSNGFPAFSTDGRALIFASDREGGLGGYDLYVSYWTGSGWGLPENLGSNINTPGDEVSPYLDGEMLYFASNWHPGFGGYDLFSSERAGNNNWGKPENLGIPVNSPKDDYGLVFNRLENQGYLTSNRPGGFGSEDIFRLRSTGQTAQLVVQNASDGQPVSFATLDFSACGRSVYNADVEGRFSFQLPPDMNCQIQVRAEGYTPASIPSASLMGQQGTGAPFQVLLQREGEVFRGQIVDYSTRQPLGNVSVEATNQATGNITQVFTDASGQYGLALAPNTNYILRYSRAGYRDVSRNVQVTDPSNTSLLGVISLYPTSSPNLPPGTNIDPDNPEVGTPPAGGGRVSGYAVQLAAVRSPSLGKFAGLDAEGTLYTVEEGGLYKVRLGVYPDKAQARQVLSRVKTKGYSSAFLVREEGTRKVGSVYGGEAADAGPGANYYVQLAAYRNPENFDASAVAGIGKVSESRRGNLTIKYLGPFQTTDEARAALSRAQAAGFTGAYVIERKPDGTIQRLHSN